MKVSVEFEDRELTPAIQNHLEGGVSVRGYIRAALRFFNTMLEQEKKGKTVGYGEGTRFEQYNTKVSPQKELSNWKEDVRDSE